MQKNTFWIKPHPGRNVLLRDPITGAPLSPLGEEKPKNAHWLRRVRDKDAVPIDGPEAVATSRKKRT